MRLAIYQSDLTDQTPAQRLDRLADVATQADADLLLCPELFLSGYAIGDALQHRAEPRDGASATRVANIARATGTAIAYGYPEATEAATYNAVQCIGPNGISLANHRKTVLPPGFEADHFTPGQGLALFDLYGIRFALLICYEVEFPEATRAAALAGAQVLLVPTALGSRWPVVAHRVLPARAFENGVYIAYANHAGHEGGIHYLGASCIVAPDGTDAARAGDRDQIISADLDMTQVTAMQSRLPYLKDRDQLLNRLK